MSVVHKLTEYAIEEVAMAEKYIKLAHKAEDAALATRLQEMAKDELKHCDFIQNTVMKMIEQEKMACKDGVQDTTIKEEVEYAFYDAYGDWKDKVVYMVNSFTVKK